MSFYQQNTIALYSWFLLVLSYKIFLMTFHGSIFLNIKLGPTTTSSPRRRGRGLHNLDSSHDQIWFFWLAEVRNFTNIMIEYSTILIWAHISFGYKTCICVTYVTACRLLGQYIFVLRPGVYRFVIIIIVGHMPWVDILASELDHYADDIHKCVSYQIL